MREALFVKQNSVKWKAYEELHTTNPDDLSDRFIEITNDLSYAKTFYPKSNTTAYLNGLASTLHQSIYKNKKEDSNRFVNFWKFELPELFHIYRKQLLYALLFFLISTAIGVLSAKYDASFLRLVLGDSYVNMTNDNIAKGNPFGVYKQHGEMEMFVMIAANNIYVAMITFVSGLFFSVGPIVFMLKNGVMLGSFEYYFFSRGLGLESILVIWIHGTLEISAIIIAGAAGLVLGHGLLFPKTYTRLQAFKNSAKDGTKMALGIVPILLVAALLEGFVTRHTQMPLWLSLSILSSSLLFIIWYVILYPIRLSKRNQKLINNA
ncbi:stage II sporulation protein M [Pedobacter sp. L105]|uniref:stage II sporulation protein M n=1 Tax=Pedobacter sp. L105 TaxID=1641871 RepID=UPI00131BC441|nr:stage II sporulation protein M [Pedobacter sp. L105]